MPAKKPCPKSNPTPAEPPPRPRRRRRRKRIAIDEALRQEDMDERKYAQTFRGFFRKVEGDKGDPKLMLDGLKEWGRHLEGKRAAANPAPGTPAIVQLVHNVARPVRTSPTA